MEYSSLNRTTDLLLRNMSVATLRRQVIINNMANAETPGFKRSEVNFEAELARALQREKSNQSIGVTTHEKHIPFTQNVDYRSVKPEVTLDYLTTAKSNGNNVDGEIELNNSVKNQMMYELMTSVMGHQFRVVNLVIE